MPLCLAYLLTVFDAAWSDVRWGGGMLPALLPLGIVLYAYRRGDHGAVVLAAAGGLLADGLCATSFGLKIVLYTAAAWLVLALRSWRGVRSSTGATLLVWGVVLCVLVLERHVRCALTGDSLPAGPGTAQSLVELVGRATTTAAAFAVLDGILRGWSAVAGSRASGPRARGQDEAGDRWSMLTG